MHTNIGWFSTGGIVTKCFCRHLYANSSIVYWFICFPPQNQLPTAGWFNYLSSSLCILWNVIPCTFDLGGVGPHGKIAMAPQGDKKFVLFCKKEGSSDFSISPGHHGCWGSPREPMESNLSLGNQRPKGDVPFLWQFNSLLFWWKIL
jgi:hypothetical protein